jgi:cob(I)alamin adenosyltransferase
MKQGYIQVYTGNGKGKTTAAVGLAMRAAGAGFRVYFCQFLKGRASSEHNALARFPESITVHRSGKKTFVIEPTGSDRLCARRCFKKAADAIASNDYSVVVLDEIIAVVRLGLIDIQELLEVLRTRPVGVEIVCTGRNAPQELLELADLVTEMKEIKHYFANGVDARIGIEK